MLTRASAGGPRSGSCLDWVEMACYGWRIPGCWCTADQPLTYHREWVSGALSSKVRGWALPSGEERRSPPLLK